MKKESTLLKIWKVVYPMGFKFLVDFIVSLVAIAVITATLMGSGTENIFDTLYAKVNEHTLAILGISLILEAPLLIWVFRNDRKKGVGITGKAPKISWLWAAAAGITACIGFNNLISLTPLPEWFPVGGELMETMYSSNLILQILVVGIFAPAVEELVFRGLVFRRLKEYTDVRIAIFGSAFLFGVYHGNMVQFVYATLVGIVLAYICEVYGTLTAPIIAHAAANLFSLLLTLTPLGTWMESSTLLFVLCGCGGIILTGYFMGQLRKKSRIEDRTEKDAGSLRSLENDRLRIEIDDHGAELVRIYDKKNQREVLWNGDPTFWGRRAPILFPFVGKVNGGVYRYMGKEYPSAQHGFARDLFFEWKGQEDGAVSHVLEASDDTMERYPFLFRLKVTHTLEENRIRVSWKVTNFGTSTMYFSIGGHPAFRVPADSHFQQKDYRLSFVEQEKLLYRLIDKDGMCDMNHRYSLMLQDGSCAIGEHLFDRDALIFEDRQIEQVSITHPDGTPYVTLHCPGFPYLGIWSVPNSPFVCLEPWYGRCDEAGFTGDISQKTGIQKLASEETFHAEYTIEVE